jgi:hypothetical protein
VGLHSLKSVDGWILLVSGLIWLAFAGDGGIVRSVLAGAVGAIGVGTGVAALLVPGDLRVVAFAALGAVVGGAVALLGLFAFGFGASIGLAVLVALSVVAAGRLSLAWVPATPGVPARVDDTALAAKVAIDEALLATFHLRMAFPAGPELDVAAREALAFREWLNDAGHAAPLDYHLTPPPIDAVRTTNQKALGHRYEHVSVASDYEPLTDEPGRDRWLAASANRTSHAYVVRHDPDAPWLVAINGYRMGMALTDLALFDPRVYCERLGFNLLIPVLPLHGPRRAGRLSGDGYIDGNIVDFVHAEAQAMWDIRRWMGWIRAQGAERIGVMGLSLGGYNCALLATLEDDLRCAIAGIPVADFSRILWSHGPGALVSGLIDRGVDREVVLEIVRPVSPLTAAPRLPREALAIFAGIGDRIVSPDHQRDLIAHWEPGSHHWYQGGHVTFRLDSAVDAMVRRVLRENLAVPQSS